MIHRRTHPKHVEGCDACRWASVSFSSDAMPTRNPRIAEINATERRWSVDMDAYKRLVEGGNQPNGIDGCADLEKRADHPMELAQMKVIDVPNKQRRLRQANEFCTDLGMEPKCAS